MSKSFLGNLFGLDFLHNLGLLRVFRMRSLKKHFLYFILSPLGITCLLLSVGLGIGLSLGWRPFFGLAVGAGMFLFLLLLTFFSGAGAKSAVEEQGRRFYLDIEEKLAQVEIARQRLATLRLNNPELKKLTTLASLRVADYLSACRKEKTHDPLASEAALECVEIADLYLAEQNEASLQKRFLSEEAPEQGTPQERFKSVLKSRIKLLSNATSGILGILSPKEELAIKEELS